MEDEEQYQIMPYKEIIALRKEIESLKGKNDDSSFQALLNSMSSLTKSMNSMLELFRTAAEEMKLEEKSEMNVSKEITPLNEKMDSLIEQNKTIAEGLIAISDMVSDFKEKKFQSGPSPVFRLESRAPPQGFMPQGPPMKPLSPFEDAFQPRQSFPGGPMPPGQQMPPFGQMRQNQFQPPMQPMAPNPFPPSPNQFPPQQPFGPLPPQQQNQFPGPMPPLEELPVPEIPGIPDLQKKKSKFLGIIPK